MSGSSLSFGKWGCEGKGLTGQNHGIMEALMDSLSFGKWGCKGKGLTGQNHGGPDGFRHFHLKLSTSRKVLRLLIAVTGLHPW